jgi:hypothetical protein
MIDINLFKIPISNSAKLFYIYLQTFNVLDGKNKQYAETLQVSTMTIINWIAELQSVNLIKLNYLKNSRQIKL